MRKANRRLRAIGRQILSAPRLQSLFRYDLRFRGTHCHVSNASSVEVAIRNAGFKRRNPSKVLKPRLG